MLTKIIHDTLVPEERPEITDFRCSYCVLNDFDSCSECEDRVDGNRPWNEARNYIISNIPLFKEKIIEEIEKLYPYNGNPNAVSRDDVINLFKD